MAAQVSEPTETSQAPTHRRKIAGATGIMMAAILASRLLGLVRNAVISHRLGQGYWADVYSGAFRIPDLLFYLIAGGALSSAFIPVFTEKITHGRRDEAWHVFSTVATVMFLVLTAFIVLGEIFAYPLVHLVNLGFPAEKIADTVPLTRIVFPAQICFFMGGLLMGAQYSLGQFKVPAMGPVIYNVGIILGARLLYPKLGPSGMVWGALGGAIAGNFCLQMVAVKRAGMVFKPSLDWRHPDVMKVWMLMLPVVLGVALPQVSIWVNGLFASTLGDGPMAALTYANQLMQVPLALFAQAMAVAIFPTLSAMAARKDFDEFRATSSEGIRALLFLTIPSSVFMFILSVPIVQLLLQGGKYTTENALVAAGALGFYCIGIFAWSAQSILSRSFYALHDTRTPVIVGTGVTLLFVPMNVLFMRTFGMGIQGLALATSVAAALHVFLMLAVLTRRLGGMDLGRMASSTGKIVLASLIAGAACWAAARLAAPLFAGSHVKLHALVVILAAGGTGVAVYAGCAHLFRIEELQMALSLLRRKRRGTGGTPPPDTQA